MWSSAANLFIAFPLEWICFNSGWEIKHPGGQPCEYLGLLWNCDKGGSQPGVGWRGALLTEQSETLKVLRGPCQLPWECGVLHCQLTVQKSRTWENCRSFISKIPLSFLLITLQVWSFSLDTQAPWKDAHGAKGRAQSPSFQAGGTGSNPACALSVHDRKPPFATTCSFSHCHCRYYAENKVEFFIGWKGGVLWIVSP